VQFKIDENLPIEVAQAWAVKNSVLTTHFDESILFRPLAGLSGRKASFAISRSWSI